MVASKTRRARKARRKSAKKTGLIALAAAALASPVATTPVIAQSPSSVSPQPSPPSSTDTKIDEAMGVMGGALVPKGAKIPQASPGAEKGIFSSPADTKPGAAAEPKSMPAAPSIKATKDKATILSRPSKKLESMPAAPSTKDKALIFTGPSKPSR